MIWLRSLSINHLLVVITAFLVLLFLWIGEVSLPLSELWNGLTHPTTVTGQIVWQIRLPRNLAAALVGVALGLSGAILQGVLRNPLAEPGLLGVNAGAGLGAAMAIFAGWTIFPFMIELSSLLGAVAVAVLLILFIRRFPQRYVLILTGVGVSSLCGALMALAFNLSPSPIATAEVLNWMMGSVENRQWWDVATLSLALIASGVVIYRYGTGLRLLTLGEDTAKSLGLDIKSFMQVIVLTASGLAALSVAVAGMIGFVGLAAPHLVRAMGNKDPAHLLWPSGLAGGLMVLLADGVVRVLPASGDVRLGVLTALIGAPLFVVLAYKSAKVWGDGQ